MKTLLHVIISGFISCFIYLLFSPQKDVIIATLAFMLAALVRAMIFLAEYDIRGKINV